MMDLSKKPMLFLLVFAFAALNTGCSQPMVARPRSAGSVLPLPAGGQTNPPAAPTALKITSASNRGVQSNGKFLVELDGQFATSSNSVTAACGTAHPTVSIVSQSRGQIMVAMDKISDTCSFIVQYADLPKAVSLPIAFAPNQTPININQANNAGLSGSKQVVSLTGTFYGSSDQIWARCDGASYAEVASVDVILDSSTEIRFSIVQPANFNSCQFYVGANGVQSDDYSMIEIETWIDAGIDPVESDYTDIRFSGRFGGSEEVYVRCDDEQYERVSETNILTESGSEISFRMVTRESYQSCEAYVISDGVQSPVIYLN